MPNPAAWLNSDQSKTVSMWKTASLKRRAGGEGGWVTYGRRPGVAGEIAEQCLPGKMNPPKSARSSNIKPLKLTIAACIHPWVARVGTHGFGSYKIVVLLVFLGNKPAGSL